MLQENELSARPNSPNQKPLHNNFPQHKLVHIIAAASLDDTSIFTNAMGKAFFMALTAQVPTRLMFDYGMINSMKKMLLWSDLLVRYMIRPG